MELPALDNPRGLAGAWIAPIRNVLARKDSVTWNHAHKGALKSAMANRQWTQQRLHKAGLSDSNLCQLCVGKQQVRNLAPSWIRDMLDNLLSTVFHLLSTVL